MPLMSMRSLRTYCRKVARLPGEPEREFANRAERAIPDLKRYVEGRHHGRHLRCVVRYSDDMGLATVEVAALKERWEP